MSPEEAAGNAAEILGEALRNAVDPERSAAMVAVADSWIRLHDALAHAPQTIGPAPQPEWVSLPGKPAPQEPVPGNVDALRELARLADYVYDNFRDDAAEGGGTIVDVAIRLLSTELMRKEVVALKERMDRVGSGQISWSPHIEGATVTNQDADLTAGWPRIQRDCSEDDT